MSATGKRTRLAAMGAGILVTGASASADVHSWHITEIFSNGSGDTQFIEIANDLNGEANFKTFNNVHLISDNTGATLQQTFVFPNDLSSNVTAGKKVLIGTANLASYGVSPDFVLPSSFIYDGGRIRFTGTTGFWGTFEDLTFSSAELPNDGVNSMLVDHGIKTIGGNSPTNFAGATGSIPEPATAGIAFLAGGAALLRRRSK